MLFILLAMNFRQTGSSIRQLGSIFLVTGPLHLRIN